MKLDLAAFFLDDTALVDPRTEFVARIAAGIADKAALLKTLKSALRFPEYFGNNWDALSDCLTDLSWIQAQRVVIVHEDWPLENSMEGLTYLDILAESIKAWKQGDAHELRVVFPATVLAHILECS